MRSSADPTLGTALFAGVAWFTAFGGYLGWVVRASSNSSLTAGALFLQLVLAGFIYLAAPPLWSLGSVAHALPGTYLFVFCPFLGFFLVKGGQRTGVRFAAALMSVPTLYVALLVLVFNTPVRAWWVSHVWSIWMQAIFLGLAFVWVVTFERMRSKKVVMLTGVSLAFLWGVIAMHPPFQGIKKVLCRDILNESLVNTSAGGEPGVFLYTRQEWAECRE